MPSTSFNSFFGTLCHMGPLIGAQKLENAIFRKSKLTSSDHIVHQRKRFRRQKCSVSLDYNWSVPKIFVSCQPPVNYGQKAISWEIGPFKCPKSKDCLFISDFLPSRDYFGDFGIQPSWMRTGESMYPFLYKFFALANILEREHNIPPPLVTQTGFSGP